MNSGDEIALLSILCCYSLVIGYYEHKIVSRLRKIYQYIYHRKLSQFIANVEIVHDNMTHDKLSSTIARFV